MPTNIYTHETFDQETISELLGIPNHNLDLSEPNVVEEMIEDNWALARRAFLERYNTGERTELELAYKKVRIQRCKEGLHNVPHSEETKKNISEKKKEFFKDKSNHPMWGRTTYIVTDPDGNVYKVGAGWKQWCIDRGLCPSNLTAVAKGKRNHHKGWTAIING